MKVTVVFNCVYPAIKSNDEHMIYIRLKTNFDKAGLYLIGASNKKGPFFIKKKDKGT